MIFTPTKKAITKNRFEYILLIVSLILFLSLTIFVYASPPQIDRTPIACTDSDGDCDYTNINSDNGVYESVDLKTSPYGWINATDWDQDVPSGNTIDNATLHVQWYTDTGMGAGNIYIGYFNATDWVDCAGPFSESASEQDTTCDVSDLSVSQINNIQVRLRGEDTDGLFPAFAYVDYIYIEVNYSTVKVFVTSFEDHFVKVVAAPAPIGYLEVELVNPPLSYNVIQNQTFNVNATVYCKGGSCGKVNGTLRYNQTGSENPNASISTIQGDIPFYITDNSNPQQCLGGATMQADDFCNLTWVVNATGDTYTDWKIGVLFNSTQSGVVDNHTNNATIRIILSQPLITLWSPGTIDFGSPNPNTYWNNATNNTDNFYNISVDPNSCTVDIWIKGTDLENITLSAKIGVGNVTWNNYFNWTISTNMSMSYALVNTSVPENTNVTTYYWLNLPPVYAGPYNGTVTVCANCTSGGDPCE